MKLKIDNYLLDDFYTIGNNAKTEDGFDAEISLNPNHWIYSSHFPENPITPGVCLLQISRELISIHFEKQTRISKIKNIKFLNILVPDKDQLTTFKCTLKTDDEGNYKANIMIENSETSFAKISIVLKFD